MPVSISRQTFYKGVFKVGTHITKNTNGSLLFLLCTRNLPGNPFSFSAAKHTGKNLSDYKYVLEILGRRDRTKHSHRKAALVILYGGHTRNPINGIE